jgi:excisionase family DNA binding protein
MVSVHDERSYTVGELVELLQVSRSTIHRWIGQGKLKASKVNGAYHIPLGEKNREFLLLELRKKRDRLLYKPYVPEAIKGYNEWHQIIDEICWLFKVCYTSRDDVKRKRFRMDRILYNYLDIHNIAVKKVTDVFSSNKSPNTKAITDDLKRGWYNELSYAIPIKKSTLGLSFNDIELNKPISNIRFSFPSWQIICAYYSIYFYLRAVTLQKFDNFRLQEHGATIACFKNNVLGPLEETVWRFPLNISYTPGVPVYRKNLLINVRKHLPCFQKEVKKPRETDQVHYL